MIEMQNSCTTNAQQLKFENRRLQESGFWDRFHYLDIIICTFSIIRVFILLSSHTMKVVEKNWILQNTNLGSTKKKCNISSGWFLRVLISIRNDINQIYNIKHRVSFLKLRQVTLWQKEKCKHFFLDDWLLILNDICIL